MHERNHQPGHIPPPDLPRHKTVLGFRPHIFVGGLVLIAILCIYLFLFVNGRPLAYFHTQPSPAAGSPNSPK